VLTYYKLSQINPKMNHRNVKRIAKDIQKFEEAKLDTIFIHPNEANIYDIKALIIGPEDSVFAGGFFYFSLDMTEYPLDPPKVKFLTPYTPQFRLHPNLYAGGKVCLSILNTWGKNDWSPLLTLEKILVTIQALLDNNPISNEPAFYNIKSSDKKAKEYAIMSRFLTMQSIPVMLERQDIPQPFHEIMRSYVSSHKEIYNGSFDVLDKHKGYTISTMHGSYKITNYKF
jgi:ubiquitin-protein ligase